MAKSNKVINVIMRSSESRFFYTTSKNKTNKEKLSLKSYDPNVQKHVVFNEEKMK